MIQIALAGLVLNGILTREEADELSANVFNGIPPKKPSQVVDTIVLELQMIRSK